jgi:hypothetical protein
MAEAKNTFESMTPAKLAKELEKNMTKLESANLKLGEQSLTFQRKFNELVASNQVKTDEYNQKIQEFMNNIRTINITRNEKLLAADSKPSTKPKVESKPAKAIKAAKPEPAAETKPTVPKKTKTPKPAKAETGGETKTPKPAKAETGGETKPVEPKKPKAPKKSKSPTNEPHIVSTDTSSGVLSDSSNNSTIDKLPKTGELKAFLTNHAIEFADTARRPALMVLVTENNLDQQLNELIQGEKSLTRRPST